MAAYTFRNAGTLDTGTGTLSPGAPAGKATGDLLLLATAARNGTETLTTPSGWTLLADTTSTANDSCALFGRIADGSASDTPTLNWSGSSPSAAQIAAWYGDVYTDLATIVAHSAVAGTTSNTSEVPIPALTISTADCLVVAVGKKQKTSTSDGGSATPPSGISTELADSWPTGATQLGFAWGYTQQTTATNFSAGSWDQSPDENLPYASLIVALKTLLTGTSTQALEGAATVTATAAGGLNEFAIDGGGLLPPFVLMGSAISSFDAEGSLTVESAPDITKHGGDSPPHDRGHRGWKPRYEEADLDEALTATARKVYRGEPLEDDPPVPPAPPADERESVLRARSRAFASQLRAQRLASLLNSRH